MRRFAISLIASLLFVSGAYAQSACPALSASGNAEVKAAAASPDLEPARLMLDKAAGVTLHPANDVRFVMAPEKSGAAGSYGGMLAVDVREAGTYQVALSGNAWIDMVQDGAAVASGAHGHGEGCKMVSFVLQPGRHVVQLSGNKNETIQVMISRQ
ncbi:MAG TPA: hypothetical protein VFI23_08335 [Rhizomicrobium sp.]|nr:hypothetical protein [Rhizomicrobium sp.]